MNISLQSIIESRHTIDIGNMAPGLYNAEIRIGDTLHKKVKLSIVR